MYPQRSVQNGLIGQIGLQKALGQQLIGDGLGAHPPGQIGDPAVGLHVHKVTPPADKLADKQPVDPQIGVGQKAELLFFAVQQQHDGRGDDRPVDGQPAVAVAEDGPPV